MNTRSFRAVASLAALLAVLCAQGCGNKDAAGDPSAPVSVTRSEGPSATKGAQAVTPQQAATAGEIDKDQQKALDMEAASAPK